MIATVGTVSITLGEVDAKALQDRAGSFGDVSLAQALYDARRAAVAEIIANTLLDQEAQRRHVKRADLNEQEIVAKAKPVSADEGVAWYKANPERVRGSTFEQLREPILSLLTQMRLQDARDAYVETLKARMPVRVMLEAPRIAVTAGNSPARGPSNAPIELIEFADFQCPYCRTAVATVNRVLESYGGRIRFVYRNFPLDIHKDAQLAAEAALCAHEQGRFWPYHDRLFGQPDRLSVADLKQAAASLGIDALRFNRCVDEHKYQSTVEADTHAGTEAGVTGTPAFFINGRMLSGAQPFDAFKHVIDEELESRKR